MEEFARVVLLILAAALIVNLVQGGPALVKRNIAAKFLGTA